jgi:hypothetical protein
MFRNRFIFYGEGLLATRPTPKLEEHPLSSVCSCLFNVFPANFHSWRSSLYQRLEDAHAVVTGTHEAWSANTTENKKWFVLFYDGFSV